MSMIIELVDKLKKYAAEYDLPPFGREIEGTKELLNQAADTIEALSAKLAAANIERSERYYGGAQEKYTVEQILDAITQADTEVISAIRYKDRDMLEDILKDYLHE